MSKEGVWVLTREHNEYNQHGEYLVAVFKEKPSIAEFAAFFSNGKSSIDMSFSQAMKAVEYIEHLRSGGGRIGTEDSWHNLSFLPFSTQFDAE